VIVPVIVALVITLVVVMAITIPRLIHTCGPNEVLIFSGRKNRKTGKHYRIRKGGWAMRVPLLEAVDQLDLTNMNIEVEIGNAFSRGGVPLKINGIANVKIAGESPGLDNALQRLLGKPRQLVMRIAKETLEGFLRGVLASLSPEEANEDTQAFERELRKQAGEGFDRLGLTLDNLKIQAINDDVGYLSALGRVKTAELARENRIAEAQRRSESLVKQADARRKGELAKIEAQINIAKAEAERRVSSAQTARTAWVAEQEGEVAALLTRARAELDWQDARLDQLRHQLEAEVVAPAKADMEARIAEARGQAAPILEQGRAQAEAFVELAKQWEAAGPAAKDIFVLQKLDSILPTYLESISRVRVDSVTMLQGGDGQNGFAHDAVSTVKALEAGGIDVKGLLGRLTGDGQAAGAKAKANGGSERRKAEPPRASNRLQPPPVPPAPLAENRGFTPTEPSGGQQPKARLIRKRSR